MEHLHSSSLVTYLGWWKISITCGWPLFERVGYIHHLILFELVKLLHHKFTTPSPPALSKLVNHLHHSHYLASIWDLWQSCVTLARSLLLMWWVSNTTSIALVERPSFYFPLLKSDNFHWDLLKMFLIKIMARPTCCKKHMTSSPTWRWLSFSPQFKDRRTESLWDNVDRLEDSQSPSGFSRSLPRSRSSVPRSLPRSEVLRPDRARPGGGKGRGISTCRTWFLS